MTIQHGLNAYKLGNETVNVLALPANKGLDFTDCLPGKPTKDPTTNKWTQVNLEPKWLVDSGRKDGNGHAIMVPASMRVAIVTSTGAATPATIKAFVKVTTNGRYIFDITRDKLTPELTAVRKTLADANKADYLVNGPPAKQERHAVTVELPGDATATTPTATATATAPTAATSTMAPGLTKEQKMEYVALGFSIGDIMAADQAVRDQAMITGGNVPHVTTSTNTPATVASVPKLAPKTPKTPKA